MANRGTGEKSQLSIKSSSFSPRRQGLVLLFLLIPMFLLLFVGADLSFRLKPPVLKKIQTITSIEYDLYSIQMSLEYLRSQLARRRGSEPLSKREFRGFLAQIDASYSDILTHRALLTPLEQRAFDHLSGLSRVPLERTALADQLSLSVQQTIVLEKRFEDSKLSLFERLRTLDNKLYQTGILLTGLFLLSIGASLYWIRNYWLSHKNLALYEALIHSQNGIAFVDRKSRRFLFVNDGFAKISGYSRDELKERTLGDLSRNIPNDLLSLVPERPSEGGNPARRFEFDLRNKSGLMVPVAMYVERSTWEGIDVLITIFYDRSEKKALEEENRKILDHLDSLIKNVGEGLIEIDRDGRILFLNPAATVVLNGSSEDFSGKTLEESGLFPDDDARALFKSRMKSVLGNGIPVEDDTLVFLRKGGSPLEVYTVFSPIFLDGIREIMGVLVSFRNIGVRKAIERKLVDSETRYRKIVEGSPDGIYLLDPDNLTLLDANSAFCRMMGYDKPEDVIGKPVTRFSRNPEAIIRENLRKMFQSTSLGNLEASFQTRENKTIPVSLNISTIQHDGSDAALVTVRDITFRKQWEGTNEFFLKLDQMLLDGTSSLDFYRAITGDLARIFSFLAVSLVIREENDAPRLQSISSPIPEFEKDVRDILGTGSQDSSEDSPVIEMILAQEAQFVEIDHYPQGFQEILQKYHVKTCYYVPIHSESGTVLGALGIAIREKEELSAPAITLLQDITQKLALSYLHQESLLKIRLLNKAFEVADSSMFITDSTGTVEWANPAYLKLSGAEIGDVVEKKHPFFEDGLPAEAQKDFWKALEKGETVQREYRQTRQGGDAFDCEIRVSPILRKERTISNLVCIEEDVSDQKALEDKVYLDPLTGLYNRAFLDRSFEGFLSSARRYKRLVSVLFFDLDGFKAVNDRFGHATGDLLLVSLSRRIEAILRGGDIAARVGGDEFVIVLNNVRMESEIEHVGKRLLSIAQEPVTIDRQEIRVGVSVGISIYPQDGDTEEVLVRRADVAMYHAKQNGKNRIVFFHQMTVSEGEDPLPAGSTTESAQV